MKISHGLMVVGLSALAAIASGAELTTFQAGQVASASEVNGNFQRLAAEDEAIRAELEAAIEEGNTRLDTAIEEGDAVLEQAISDGAAQLETLKAQVSALLEEVDGLTSRLAQIEGDGAGAGGSATTTPTAFSPVGTWTYLAHDTGLGFNNDQTTVFHEVFSERGIVVFGADGTLRSVSGGALSGGVFATINKGSDGLVLLEGLFEKGADSPIIEEAIPIEGVWVMAEKANGAAISVTIFDGEDGGEGDEFSFDLFKGSSEFMHSVVLDNEGGPNDSKGLLVTSVSFFKHAD